MALPKPGSQWHLAVGNINLDISVSLPRHPEADESVFAGDAWIGVGGAATNYAIAVARLGQRVSLVARAGEDAVRLGILDSLSRLGVDVSGVVVARGEPIGVVVVLSVPGRSARTMITVRGANEGLSGSLVPGGLGGHVHFASTRGRIVVEALERLGGKTVSYDPGGEAFRDRASVLEALEHVDWVLLNERELGSLTGSGDASTASRLLRGRVKAVVVKHGRGGATLVSRCGSLRVEAPPVDRVVDVTGAGDAFDAAFNIWMLSGRGGGEALRAAVAAGAAKVALRGSSNMPGPGEVEELLSRTGEPRGVARAC